MTIDRSMERLYEQIELVKGVGNRHRGTLCIMSFVAFLAGEDHTDDPRTASSLIRRLAITVNDEMPGEYRQRLKTFAPRIIGTRDGFDCERAKLLVQVAESELLPRITREFPLEAAGGHTAKRGRQAGLPVLLDQFDNAVFHVRAPGMWEDLAFAFGRIVCWGAKNAETSDQQEWFWLKATDVLDQLCDIGVASMRPAITAEHLAFMQTFLSREGNLGQRRSLALTAWACVRNLIPA